MKHLRYLRYVVLHRWCVTLECFKRGLWLRGLLHDLSKFRPSEWLPYAEHFYGRQSRPWRDATGYYEPTNTGDSAFDFAWLLHQHRNDHHWQWWSLVQDEDENYVLPMSKAARAEMLCDWIGASRAQGHGGMDGATGVRAWYKQRAAKMQLHRETREWIEREVGIRLEV